MKKFVLSVLALVGVVSGFALTSCGGGGGSGSAAGTCITVNGPLTVYEVYIAERFGDNKTSAYTGTISDHRGFRVSNVMYSLSDVVTDEKGLLRSCSGTISPTTLNAQDQYALYMIVMGLDMTDTKITNLQMTSAASFVLSTDENGKGTIKWVASAEYDYALGDVLDEDVTNDVDRTDNVLYINRR
jgi:hypothetical protein